MRHLSAIAQLAEISTGRDILFGEQKRDEVGHGVRRRRSAAHKRGDGYRPIGAHRETLYQPHRQSDQKKNLKKYENVKKKWK